MIVVQNIKIDGEIYKGCQLTELVLELSDYCRRHNLAHEILHDDMAIALNHPSGLTANLQFVATETVRDDLGINIASDWEIRTQVDLSVNHAYLRSAIELLAAAERAVGFIRHNFSNLMIDIES